MSRLTTFYFVFSVLHAISQVALQAQAFSLNAQAAAFLWNVVQQGTATVSDGFMVLHQDLRMCEVIPNSFSVSSCEVVWAGTPANDTQNSTGLGPTGGGGGGGGVSTASAGPSKSPTSVPLSPFPTVHSSSTLGVPQSSFFPPTQVPSDTSLPTTTVTTVPILPFPTTSSDPHTSLPIPLIPIGPNIGGGDGNNNTNEFRRRNSPEAQAVQVSGQTGVRIDGLGFTHSDVVLDHSCLLALNWPATELNNTKREDIVFIAFQLWLLGMSIVALLNESIPHVLASLVTHMMATGWSGFQISHTTSFRASFTRLTTAGACKSINLLPTYWVPRGNAEQASLALNAVALLVAAVLSWRLTKAFGWRTFKRIGASLTINRQYTAVLVLSIAIQISLFFIVVAVSLWLDQLYHGAIGRLASHRAAYKAMLSLVLLLLFPWLTMGWFSVRRESKILMLVFLSLSSLYLVAWGTMFASAAFRWTFVQWYFFGTMTCASVFLTTATLVCGGICRLGFGKGLPRYLNAQEPLTSDNLFTPNPSDMEKVEFPSEKVPIPTFSVAFGSSDEVPPPSQTQFAPRQMGPRFFNNHLEHFDPQPPRAAFTRPPSHRRSFTRTGSTGSAISYQGSDSSISSSHDEPYTVEHARVVRWVTE